MNLGGYAYVLLCSEFEVNILKRLDGPCFFMQTSPVGVGLYEGFPLTYVSDQGGLGWISGKRISQSGT